MEVGSDFSHRCSSMIDGIMNMFLFLTNIILNSHLTNVFVMKILAAYYVCCIFSNGLKNMFTMEANTMHPDQTAPHRIVQSDLGPYCLR